jgi:hypothetical protein
MFSLQLHIQLTHCFVTLNQKYEILGSQSDASVDASLWGCDAVLLGV